MALNKQGVFFTFTALIFLSLLIFSSSLLNTYEMREKHFVIETRINTINNFLSDVEQDIQRAAYISGFRALLEITNHLATTGTYLSNVNQSFNELFLNGTLNNTNSSLMANNTFPDWIEKIKNESEKVDILVNFSINTVSISQDNPWSVRVDLNLELDLSPDGTNKNLFPLTLKLTVLKTPLI